MSTESHSAQVRNYLTNKISTAMRTDDYIKLLAVDTWFDKPENKLLLTDDDLFVVTDRLKTAEQYFD